MSLNGHVASSLTEKGEEVLSDDDSDDLWPEIEMMTKTILTKEAFHTLIEQVGTMYASWETMQRTTLENSLRISQMTERLNVIEANAYRSNSSTPPSFGPQLVEASDTLGSLLEEYVQEDTKTGTHKVITISRKELEMRRFSELKKAAEARETLARLRYLKGFIKHYVAKGAGHALSHIISLLVGGAVIYFLHRAGKL